MLYIEFKILYKIYMSVGEQMKECIYRKLIEDSPIPYIYLKVVHGENEESKQVKVLDINKSFESILGISKDRVINLDVRDFLDNKQYTKLLSKLNSIAHNEYSTFIFEESENSFFNIEVYMFEKDAYHIRATRINEYNNNFSKFIKQLPFAMWVKDRNGRYIDVNEQCLKSFKVPYSDIIGKLPEEVWDIEDARNFREKDKQVILENMIHRDIERIKVKDNNNYYFEIARWPYTDETGDTILGTMGIAIEITDKMKLKEAIEKNEETFFDMANNIDELIIIRDEKKHYM